MWQWLRALKPAPVSLTAAPAEAGGIANYRLERLIGKGAGSQVFLAQDRRSGRWVALKVLELGGSPATPQWHDALERFRREATLLHELDHPGIVGIVDAGPTDDGAWMAMQPVFGC